MEKFVVVLFRVIEPAGSAFREVGGGVVFFPEPRPEAWHGTVAELVREHFLHELGPAVEIGYATLDRALLERHCQQHGEAFWQGGDSVRYL